MKNVHFSVAILAKYGNEKQQFLVFHYAANLFFMIIIVTIMVTL
jgi:hypothetical protein